MNIATFGLAYLSEGSVRLILYFILHANQKAGFTVYTSHAIMYSFQIFRRASRAPHNPRANMEDSSQIDYLYCSHCNGNVSRSTYQRHQLMTVKRKRKVSSSSDSKIFDSDGSETSNDDSRLVTRLDPPNPFPNSLSIKNGKQA